MSVIRFFNFQDTALHITEFGYSVPQKERQVGPWVRNTFLLHYVAKGVCHFDGFDAHAGTAFFIAKDCLHSFKVQPPYAHYWFAFDGDTARQLLSQYGISPHTHRLFSVCHPSLAENILKNAFESADSDNGAVAAESALYALFPLFSTEENSEKRETDSRIPDAAKYIEMQYSHTLTMEQVADHVHLSEKHFCKRFKAIYGIPPQQYLLKVRMTRAAQLLSTTPLQIQEVATSVGFHSPLYFSNAFKKFFGVSPKEYRNNQKTAVN